MPRLTLRIDFDADRAIGPGRIQLLELIDKYGSISEAGRQMGMEYRRAWILVDKLNHCFRGPVVAAPAGGKYGGGAVLTEFGHRVVQHYRAVEAPVRAGAAHIKALSMALAEPTTAGGTSPPHEPRILRMFEVGTVPPLVLHLPERRTEEVL